MTKGLKSITHIARRVGGVRNLLFILLAALLGLTILLDIWVVERIFDPLVYLYLAVGIVVALYVIPPLYVSRRLVQYYGQRARRNRLAVVGLAFILFLILLAIIGPFLTADPTEINFEEKNLPPPGFTLQETVYHLETGQFITKTATGIWEHPLGTDNKG